MSRVRKSCEVVENLSIRFLLTRNAAPHPPDVGTRLKLEALRERRGEDEHGNLTYLCPVCDGIAVSNCRCSICDKTCENGHKWIVCRIDGNLVVPAYDTHASGKFFRGECWCHLGQVFPPRKASKTAKTNQKVIESPHNFHQVELQPAKKERKEFPFEGFIDFQGIKIDVENAKGGTRSGTTPDGTEWSSEMFAHYGEVRKTTGVDLDPIDVYVGDNVDSSIVVVVHQHDPATGDYDEDKVLLGFDSVEEALGAYKKQYDRPGFYRDGEHTAMPIGTFWRWVHDDQNKGKRMKLASHKLARRWLFGSSDHG